MLKHGTISKKSALKFCNCFKIGHDKTKLKPMAELSKKIRRDIESMEEDESSKTVL